MKSNMTLKDAYSHAVQQAELWNKKAHDLKALMEGGEELPSERKRPGPKPGFKRTAAKKAGARGRLGAKSKQARKKPGPKPKAKAVVQARKKPGPKPKALKASTKGGKGAAPVKGAKTKPNLISAAQMIIASRGNTEMNAAEIHAELRKRHWLPNSDDPLGYLRYTLSANKDIFLRVEGKRGFYKLDRDNQFLKSNGSSKAPEAQKAAAQAAPAPKAPKAAKVETVETKTVETKTVTVEPARPVIEPPPVVETPKVETKKVESVKDDAESLVDDILADAMGGANAMGG